jgi:hypothetical protein
MTNLVHPALAQAKQADILRSSRNRRRFLRR